MVQQTDENQNLEADEDQLDSPQHRAPRAAETVTNLMVADIVLRGASSHLQRKVESLPDTGASQDQIDKVKSSNGRTILTTLGLYGASKLARKSLSGLALVTGALVLKTLHDRGKARQGHPNTHSSDDESPTARAE